MNGANIRVMLDSNILISAILNRHGIPNKASLKAANPPYALMFCDQILVELQRIFNLKFPSKINVLKLFLKSRLRKYRFIIL
jgi:predicted nucleic acid-binding protein